MLGGADHKPSSEHSGSQGWKRRNMTSSMTHSVHMIIFHRTKTWSNLYLGPPTLIFTYFLSELNFFNIQFHFAPLVYNMYFKITDNISSLFALKEIKLLFILSMLLCTKPQGPETGLCIRQQWQNTMVTVLRLHKKDVHVDIFLDWKSTAVAFPDYIIFHVFKS